MAAHGGQTDPALLQQRKVGVACQRHGQCALAEIAGQGGQRQRAVAKAQHVAGAGVAGAQFARVRQVTQVADQHGKGDRAEQIGDDQPEQKVGMHAAAPGKMTFDCSRHGSALWIRFLSKG